MSIDNTLVLAIVAPAGYAAVTDAPDRQVITITMPRVELERIVAQARIDAAREAFDAARTDSECFLGWRVNPGQSTKGRM